MINTKIMWLVSSSVHESSKTEIILASLQLEDSARQLVTYYYVTTSYASYRLVDSKKSNLLPIIPIVLKFKINWLLNFHPLIFAWKLGEQISKRLPRSRGKSLPKRKESTGTNLCAMWLLSQNKENNRDPTQC